MRPLFAFTFAFALLVACGVPPPATPTKAEATKDLVVCWAAPTEGPDPEEIGVRPEAIALRRAVRKRIEEAGYTLAPKKCDLRVRWHDDWKERGGDKWFSKATLTMFTPKGEVIDVVEYELERRNYPVEEPDRLAILFVNSMNGSAKVAAYAEKQRQEKATPPPSQ